MINSNIQSISHKLNKMKNLRLILICLFVYSGLQAQTTTEFKPSIKFKGLVHSRFEYSLTDSVDVSNKFSENPVQANFRMRRIELRADYQVSEKLSGVIRLQLPELKGSSVGKVIELAYGEYKMSNAFKVRFGQFKTPFELDELTSHEDLRMIDRGPTSTMFVNNSYSSYQPGLMILGELLKDKTPLNYYFGVFNGSNRAVNNDVNTGKNIAGRIEFSPVKGIRLGVNGQIAPQGNDVTGNAGGADLSIIRDLSDKLNLIVEGEFVQGSNLTNFALDTLGTDISEFNMSGYFGQALFRIKLDQPWCKTFEIGGKYENTDPMTDIDDNAFNTITGTIGFIFLPDNNARLQFNIVHTEWEKEVPGALINSNMFVTQLQIKI